MLGDRKTQHMNYELQNIIRYYCGAVLLAIIKVTMNFKVY